jgi:CHC2 zinc finger
VIGTGWIEQARLTPIERVLESRGIRLKGGKERCGPCPICGGVNRFSVNTTRQVFNCRGCGGKGRGAIDVVQFLDGCDFPAAVATLVDRRERPLPKLAPVPTKAPDGDGDLKRSLASAARIASELVPISGSPGEAYLRDARKIDVSAIADVLSDTAAIGWHPAVYFNEPGHQLHAQRLGCIVGIMTDPVTAQPTGAISRTYIYSGTKVGKAKTLGRPVGIIRLTPDEEVTSGLCLAEGLESALFAMARGFRPMWSTGSAGIMRTFPVLNGVEALTLFVDHDRPKNGETIGSGEQAARETEACWLGAGREVRLIRTRAFGDINDSGMRAA